MRIAVVSPHASNNGNTVLSMLIALELSSNGHKTCITHLKPKSNSFYSYFNFIGFQDKTSTPTQIVKILKEGGLDADDISDYCKQITDDLEAFTNEADNFNQDDMTYMHEYMAKSFPHEHVVYDVDGDEIEESKNIIQLCDVVVLNITQSIKEQQAFLENKDKYMALFEGKPLIVVINKYNSVKGTIKETANWMGIKKPNKWLVLHENPWIAWGTNHGNIAQISRKMNEKDIRVIELKSDISKICSTLGKAKALKNKRGGGWRK